MNITLTIQEAQEMLRGYIRRGPDGGLFDSAAIQIVPDELPNVVEPRDIAPGHNPDGLTAAQVGIADGWRLLSKDEVPKVVGCSMFPDTQWWRGGGWSDIGTWATCHDEGTLRTDKPPGHHVQYAKPQA